MPSLQPRRSSPSARRYLARPFAGASLAVALAAPATAQWTVVVLDPPGTVTSECYRVQDGQQVGKVDFGNGPEAVRWSGTAASVVSMHPTGALQSFARGVEAGRQAGISYPVSVAHAGYWTGTAASFVDLHPTGATESSAFDLAGNTLVGEARISNITQAGVWNLTTGAWTSLHPTGPSLPPTYSTIYASDGAQHGGGAVYGGNQHAMVWNASSGGYTDLHPAGATSSFVLDVHLGQQVGRAMVGTNNRASLWTGTAGSWIDLTPPTSTRGSANGVHLGEQCGEVSVSIYTHASVWQGTAASWTDLHGFLPAGFTGSQAFGIWHDLLGTTYVVGVGYLNGHNRAVMWVKNAPLWSNVGFAKAGINGPPQLVGTGPLTGNSANTVTLTAGAGSASALLVIGIVGANMPFLGGVLVPDPLILVPLTTSAPGAVSWPFVLPAGLPPGLPLRFQHWIADPVATFGYSASNGLLGICQ